MAFAKQGNSSHDRHKAVKQDGQRGSRYRISDLVYVVQSGNYVACGPRLKKLHGKPHKAVVVIEHEGDIELL